MNENENMNESVNTNAKATVILVDKDSALRAQLEDHGAFEVVATAESLKDAFAQLRESKAGYILLGASSVADEADRKALASLTPRERVVLYHMALGETNAELGKALTISEKTVKNHVSHLLRKLGLPDRTRAAAFAWASGFPFTRDGIEA